ncbi:MAG: CUAEP/CCAEP-tail radical SAM protein [Dehalococcoidia bacterium]
MSAAGSPPMILVSTYESGHQPLGLAAPAAALRAAGFDVACLDLAVETANVDLLRAAKLIAISIPMHTAARLGVAFARRVRALNPGAHLAFYGLYAAPLAPHLAEAGLADSTIGGEYEPGLVALAHRILSRVDPPPATVSTNELQFLRQRYPIPDRTGLPALDHYARLVHGHREALAGYVEATRGCAHTCTHCPITPVYAGRLRLVQPEVVLADIAQQVAAGATHITFGDPDFFNARPHALGIVDALHQRHPSVTFDVTVKVEHLIEHADVLPRLRELGCLFVTSAFESTNATILHELQKGHSPADLDRALQLASAAGLVLRPTWVPFTPWTTLNDILRLLDFVESRGLVRLVQPVQYALRLLLPPGSPLIDRIRATGHLTGFDLEGLTYTWSSPDPRVDALQSELMAITESAAASHDGAAEPVEQTFARVKRAACRAASGYDEPVTVAAQPQRPVPGLTEAWFC